MLSLNVYSEFFSNLKLIHEEQIFDEDHKSRLDRMFYVMRFCILIKTTSIQILGMYFYTSFYRTKLALQNAQFALLSAYSCRPPESVAFQILKATKTSRVGSRISKNISSF
jgi:hypothetical protein